MTWKFRAALLSSSNNLIPPPRIDGHNPDLIQLVIQRSDRHLSNDIVSLRLVTVINDLTFLFVRKHGIGSRGTISPLFRWIDDSAIQNEKRFLNLGYKLPHGTWGDMRRIDVQTSPEPLITLEEFRLQGHGKQKQ